MYTEHREDRRRAEEAKKNDTEPKPKLTKKQEALRHVRVDSVATTPSRLEGDKVLETPGGLDNQGFQAEESGEKRI